MAVVVPAVVTAPSAVVEAPMTAAASAVVAVDVAQLGSGC